MKQLKKLLTVLMCVGVVMSVTACGSNNNADDNGATRNETTENNDRNNTYNNNTTDKNNGNINGATDRTDNNGNREGVLDEIGDDLRNGADNVEDTIEGERTRDNADNNKR